jgi:hypothetical protein
MRASIDAGDGTRHHRLLDAGGFDTIDCGDGE